VSQNVILAGNTFLTLEMKFVTTLKNGTKIPKYKFLRIISEHKDYNVRAYVDYIQQNRSDPMQQVQQINLVNLDLHISMASLKLV